MISYKDPSFLEVVAMDLWCTYYQVWQPLIESRHMVTTPNDQIKVLFCQFKIFKHNVAKKSNVSALKLFSLKYIQAFNFEVTHG